MSRARWKGIGEAFKVLASSCLSLQLAKRWKDSDRDDFLDDFGSENEDLRARKLKSPPVQQVRKEEGLLIGEEKRERKGEGGRRKELFTVFQHGPGEEQAVNFFLVLLQHTCL